MSIALLSLLFALQAMQGSSAQSSESGAPAAAPASAAAPTPVQTLRADLATAQQASDRNDPVIAGPIYERALKDPLFRGLSAEERHDALKNAAWIDYLEGRFSRAAQRTQAAMAIRDDDPDDAYHLMLIDLAAKRPTQAADRMLALLRRWSFAKENIASERFYEIAEALEGRPAEKAAYLQGLFDLGWDDGENNASSLWMDLIDLRLARGELAQAKQTLERVDGASEMIHLRVDRRYDAIVDRASPRFDAAASAQRAVDALEVKARARPANLAVRVQLTYALLDAGRLDRVIEVVDEALGANAKNRLKSVKFDDPDQMEWLLNNRAMARFRLGQTDQAIADMRRASAQGAGDAVNVGTGLNLGALYCALGRADDARAAVATVPEADMSDFGRAVRAVQQVCAAVITGDAAQQAQAMAFLRAHRRDIPESYFDALLLLGRLDEAAAQLIAELDDPDRRGDRLAQAQDTLQAPEYDGNRRWRASYRALLARPDVHAAIERVGRIERDDVYVGHDFN